MNSKALSLGSLAALSDLNATGVLEAPDAGMANNMIVTIQSPDGKTIYDQASLPPADYVAYQTQRARIAAALK